MIITVNLIDDLGNVVGNIVLTKVPTREDAKKEFFRRKPRNGKNSLWKAKIFAAGAMWMLRYLTGISDVVGDVTVIV